MNKKNKENTSLIKFEDISLALNVNDFIKKNTKSDLELL